VPDLASRLYALGLAPGTTVTLTRNHTVLISWRATSGLRLHAGYAAAPDTVLQAIVRFLARRVPRAERRAARRIFMMFPVHQHAESRPERLRAPRPIAAADQPLIDRLSHVHEWLNARHFAGALGAIPIRISDRMRSRLGELRASRSGAAVEIILSRRHIRRDGWDATCDTLLHEMVHQWQAANGQPLDHGREFRRKATEVGITPRAVADL
jgi:SprT-like family